MKTMLRFKSGLVMCVCLFAAVLGLANGSITENSINNNCPKATVGAAPQVVYTGQLTGHEGTFLLLSANTTVDGIINYSVSNGTGMAFVSGNTLNLVKAGTVTLTITLCDSSNQIYAGLNKTITIAPKLLMNVMEDKTFIDVTYRGAGPSREPVYQSSMEIGQSGENALKVQVKGNVIGNGSVEIYDVNNKLVKSIAAIASKAGANEIVVPIEGLPSGSYLIKFESSSCIIKKKVSVNY